MSRVKSFDQGEAMEQALGLFWERGYQATSLSDLTHRLSIGKGSFYDTFGSKRKLFDQCLAAYQSGSFEILDSILAEKTDPVESVKHLLAKHTEMMLAGPVSRGCFIANSTAELADDVQVQAFLEEHNQTMRAKLTKIFDGSPLESQAEAISDMVLIHMTGISVMSKVVRDSQRFNSTNELFVRMLCHL